MTPGSAVTSYVRTRRRMLLDMHIPDWDVGFLAEYDPAELARLYRMAGADGALLYCKSHLGLSYWPTPVGGVHRAAVARDLVGEAKSALEDEGISVAAYHSVIFDSCAAAEHPEWRIVPASRESGTEWTVLGHRYGTLCPSHRDYVAYEKAQITALLERYDFDTLWLDMAFWTAVCVCAACSGRFRDESGREIPRVVDWTDDGWVAFQSARERWIRDFVAELMDCARAARPGIAVTHNLAPGLRGWFQAQRVQDAALDDFAAGDLYGGFDEQVFVLALMRGLRRRELPEFMTTRTRDLFNHSVTKSEHEMLTQAFAAVAADAAFLFIDAVDPSGRLNEEIYRRIGRVFERTRGFEGQLGGRELTEVAIYYSDDSRIEGVSALALGDAVPGGGSNHQDAVLGAVRALRRAHIPFSVVTRLDNEHLSEFEVVVLPDAARLSSDDVDALRRYVSGGGRLYSSGRSSLVNSSGGALETFALADVLGCDRVADEDGAVVYLRPESEGLRRAALPEPYLQVGRRSPSPTGSGAPLRIPRIEASADSRVLARLTLPFGYPSDGTRDGRDFASIHSSPPWNDVDSATVVSHCFGSGRAVYSAAPVEAAGTNEHEAFFIELITGELALRPTVTATAHPDVWITAFEQADRSRIVACALRLVDDAPSGDTAVTARIRMSRDREAAGATALGSGRSLPVTRDGDVAIVDFSLTDFEIVALDYYDSN